MASQRISIVVIAAHRTLGYKLMAPLFENTPYSISAFLDFKMSPEPYRYTPHNLGVVLNALLPRPRALVIGNNVDVKIVNEVELVWKDYVKSHLQEDEGNDANNKNVLVPVSWQHSYEADIRLIASRKKMPKLQQDTGVIGEPPSGWERQLLEQLDNVFRPKS